MELIALPIGLLLGYTIAFLIHGIIRGKNDRGIARSEWDALEAKHRRLEQENHLLQADHRRDREQLKKFEEALEKKSREYTDTAGRLAAANERIANLEEDIQNGKKDLEAILNKNKAEFENLARKILDDQSAKFTEKNREKLDEVLKPFQVKIQEFREKVEFNHKEQNERFVEFKTNLENLKSLNQQVSEEANNLANALRGESKTQGIWGEMLLEKILEKSGLTEGEEYTTQDSFTTEVDGRSKRYMPDVLVHLPGQRQVVIDSKVSLKAFTDYVNAEDEAATEAAAKAHVLSVSNHIKGISRKNYQHMPGVNSLDFILVFIPIEAAFNLALQRDTSLYDTAFEKNIVIVTPSTLLATLRVVENLWRQEKQNRNALRIADEAGKLYDKFTGFLEDMKDLDQRLKQARNAFDNAENKLHTGRGNLIGRTEKLKALGARTSKQLPSGYQERIEQDDRDEPDDIRNEDN